MFKKIIKLKMLFCGILLLALSGFANISTPSKPAAITAKLLDGVPEGNAVLQAQAQLDNHIAAMVIVPDGLMVVGGVEKGAVTDRVVLIKGVSETELPVFPEPVALAGAAMMNGRVYVVGGLKTLDSQTASSAVYSLDLNDFSKGWTRDHDLPGPGRLSPSMAVFNDELHVFGGWALTKTGREALADGWGFRVKPLDGTTHTGWRPLKKMPVALAEAAVYPTGQAHVALVGGFTASDKPSDQIFIYNTVTDTWVPGGQLPQPVGGGVVVRQDSETLLVSTDAPVMKLTLTRAVKTLSAWDYGVVVLYFLCMAGVGAFFASRQKTSDEYALGNRNVKWWAAGISMFATGASAITLMATPALVFRTNLVWFFPTLFFIVIFIVQAYILFPLLRRLQLTSTFEYLECRFHPSLRFLASFQCIIFHAAGRMSVVLLLPALAVSAVTGLNVGTSVLVMGVIATFYTAMGGFDAVIWTDVIQGTLMILGILMIILFSIHGLPGGWGEFVATNKTFHRFDLAIWSLDCSKPVVWLFMLAILAQGVQVVADQPTIQRVFSTPLKDVRRLAGMSALCSILIAALVVFSGLGMFAYFHANPLMMDPGMANDQIMPLYVVQALPNGVAGLVIVALFAASLSTLAGSMNSVATLVGEDFYRRMSKRPTDHRRLVIMKVTSILIGVIGTGLAYLMSKMEINSMFQIWAEVSALLGGGFVGIYLLGMFTRRTSSVGAAVGAIGSILCTVMVKKYSGLHWVFYGLFAILACVVIGYAASWIFPSRRTKALSGLTVFDPIKTPAHPE